MTLISIIIPTKDREEIFNKTLQRAFEAIKATDAEIIVVNDSKAKEIVLDKFYEGVKVIKNPFQGVASARNYGAQCSSSDLLFFLDDDMLIDQDIVHTALALHEDNPDFVYNFNWEYPPELRRQIKQKPFGRFLEHIQFTTMQGWCRGMEWHDDRMFQTELVAGATLLISKKKYESIGGYDASFPLAGAEDYDFSKRLLKAGVKSFIYPMKKAWHNEVNKTEARGFFRRVYNNAITRKHGVNTGYAEMKTNYSSVKKIIYNTMNFFNRMLLHFAAHWINLRFLDFIYFRFCNMLMGFYIYKGYNNKPFER